MGQELFQHGNLEGGYIHRITNWRFVDTAARMDPSNMFTFRDLDKVCYDAETQEYYALHKILTGFIPEWKLLSAVDAQGEANTLYKIGTGVALNGPKVGVTLGIKSVTGTANRIDVTEDVDGTVRFNVSANLSIPFVNVTGVPAYLPATYVPPLATSTTDGTITAADFNKLSGIQSNATANSSDAVLKDRANHTGAQAANTISDLQEAVQDIMGSSIVAGASIAVTYNDALGTVKIDALGGITGTTNLNYVPSPSDGQVTSDTGTDATIPAATGTNAGLMTPAQVTQLAGLGTMSTQNANAVAVTGGAIDGTPIGATTRALGRFTSVDASMGAKFGNVANADPTVLNWYDRNGVFTPSIVGSTTAGAPTAYTRRIGNFTRLGNKYSCHIEAGWTGHTGAGALRITGIPDIPLRDATVKAVMDGIAYTSGYIPFFIIGAGAAVIDSYQLPPTGAWTIMPLPVNGYIILDFDIEV